MAFARFCISFACGPFASSQGSTWMIFPVAERCNGADPSADRGEAPSVTASALASAKMNAHREQQ
jgi:hypothetical protein